MVLCTLCNKSFLSLKEFKNHYTFYHPGSVYVCPFVNSCGRSYQLYNSFRRHYLNSHTDSEPSEPCSSKFQNENDNNNCTIQGNQAIITKNQNSNLNSVPFSDTLAKLFSSLYSNPYLPNNVVDTVYRGIENMFKLSVTPLLPIIQDNNIEKMISDLERFSSSHKRMQFFEKNGSLIIPQAYVVGRRYDFVKKNGRSFYQAVECVAHKIPIHDVLHKFFSLPNLLHQTVVNMTRLMAHDTSKSIEHFMHGSFWRQKDHGEKLVMPVFVQIDDFEALNPLGSHSGIHKLGAAYISIPCLPYYYVSQLTNIFLAILYHSNDRVEFGNQMIFQPLIDQFNDLIRNGISFDLPDFKGTVYFELALILGDNLGLHSVLGFVESFSCHFPCRTCKINKKDMEKQFYEDTTLLRSDSNYQQDLAINNPSLTGVKQKCVWLQIENFCLFSQTGFDVMHDLHEGCSKYVICSLLVVFVDVLKYFTMETVNDKISSFQFGPDTKDKPVTLSMSNIRKGNIRLNAAEMYTFCKYFGVMLGDFVPRANKYWELYVQLMRVLDFILSPAFSPEQVSYFQFLAADFCEMFTTLSNQTLKLKFHNLVHYHSAMLRFGPLQFLSSMRYEAKHRPNKLASKSSNNRVNMTLTIARKHQLMLNNIFINESIGTSISFGIQKEISSTEISQILDKMTLPNDKPTYRVSWAEKCSERYKVNAIIISAIKEDNICFAKVLDIFVYGMHKIIFKVKHLKTISFDEHYHAYNVTEIDSSEASVFIDQESLQNPFICNCVVKQCDFNHPEFHVILRKPI